MEQTNQNLNNEKHKSILVSIILSILIPGGALYYIGKPKTANIFLYFVIIFNLLCIYLSAIFNTAYIMLFGYIILILALISSVIIPIVIIYYKKPIAIEKNNIIINLIAVIVYLFIIFYHHDITNKLPATIFSIPTGSMKNTILVGDNIIALKTKKIKRGDISIFQFPKNPNIFYVKRCIALDGDLVAIKNKHLLLHLREGNEFIKKYYKNHELVKDNQGNLYIVDPYIKDYPGIHHDSSITLKNSSQYKALFDLPIIKIPKNNFFMMGDNREHSSDSRFIGTIPKKFIYGKTNLVFTNYDLKKLRFNIKIK